MKEAPTRTQAKAARRAPLREVAVMTSTLGNVVVLLEDHFPPFFGDHFLLGNLVRGTDNARRRGAL
ncbi:hypothetical protein ATE80_07070 [Streptomyces kanasensis]|uniref:Uncharacterized protein n=1 Tax=Streptomyces kanasensis TaxID=936756 RepID=A0A117IXC8_9ACTN|nr:hypothetical protein ATE80_07070 [Streptomyces kanasensis]